MKLKIIEKRRINTSTLHYSKGINVNNGIADCIGIILVRKGQLP